MGILSWFLDKIRGLIGLVVPLAGKAAGPSAFGSRVRWVIHFIVVAAILVGLHYVNWWCGIHNWLPGQPDLLRYNWLPLLFVISYVLCWLGWWLWKLLVTEDEYAEFPDITDAWDEAQVALGKAGIDLREVPLFLVVGRTESGMGPLFSASKLKLPVQHVPTSPDAPLHVFASPEAVFVTCEGASLLGRQGAFLHGSGAGAVANPGALIYGEGGKPLEKTYIPGVAEREIMEIPLRAKKEGREQSPDERRQGRALWRRELYQKAPIRNREEKATYAARFEHLCRLIVRDRAPYVPVNGVLVLLPFAATDSDQDALDTGATCEVDVKLIHRTLQVHAPTIALVCDLETAPGFGAFLEGFTEEEKKKRIGHRSAWVPDLGTWAERGESEHKARAAILGELGQWVFSAVVSTWVSKHFRIEAPGRDDLTAVTQVNAQLFLFMNALRERRRRLGRLLSHGFALESDVPVWFGGCYIAGTGPDSGAQQGFVAGVFAKLFEAEKEGLVSWTAEAVADEAGYRRWIALGQAALVMILAAVVLAGVGVWLWPKK
jgi:hypothetical protein